MGNLVQTYGTIMINETEMGVTERLIKYPVAGILSFIFGYIITNLWTFNIHNGEGLIWALIMLGLWIILPTYMFIKSVRLIVDSQKIEKRKIRTYSIILTTALGLLITSMLVFSLGTKH